MADIVRVLPDAVANQIAAGEVIQRPASVIKELVENSVDAGSDRIQVIVKDAGKALIQVVDNGCGMSEGDARLSFERHATSKISNAADLFAIRTMGFRGEALASIASIAQVEVKTRRVEDEMGTMIRISGSSIESQEPVACSPGTSFSIKNLFYNVPARRRFLKSTSTELKHIITEFQRIALAHPGISISLSHNGAEVYNLAAESRRERISHVFGTQINQNLVPLDTRTSIVNISGYIGKPEKARKTYGEQFFFVNNRFMRHHYFHKAVMNAYGSLLQPESFPSYFIFLEIDPAHIDINIHPTKTEVKFDDEAAIFQMLMASVKEGLGRFNISPPLDFNQDGAIEIPVMKRRDNVDMPEIRIDPGYNPFENERQDDGRFDFRAAKGGAGRNWEMLFEGLKTHEPEHADPEKQETGKLIQLKQKFIVTPVKSGLMLIHQARAMERIRYEELLNSMQDTDGSSQKKLFPVQIDLNTPDLAILRDIQPALAVAGFEIEQFGGNTVIIHAIPVIMEGQNPQSLLENLLEHYKQETFNLEVDLRDKIARSLASASSRISGSALGKEEMQAIIDRLFACKVPQLSPDGKKILTILQMEELEKRFS